MTYKLPTTDLRGLDLLDMLVEHIRKEIATTANRGEEDTDAGDWRQGTWGTFNADRVARYLTEDNAYVLDEQAVPGLFVLPRAAATECGTAFCVAGHAVMVTDEYDLLVRERSSFSRDVSDLWDVRDRATGRRVTTEDAAAELLGLTGNQATALFDGDNTFQDIVHIVAAVKAGRDVEKCGVCDEYPWICSSGGTVCPGCYHHEDECTCDDED